MLFATVAQASSAADPAADAYETARASYKALKAKPEKDLGFRQHWENTIKAFEVVSKNHPKSALADDALYTIGTLYYELYEHSHFRSDLKDGAASFEKCAKNYAASNYADDCLFWEAKSLHLLDKHAEEVAALQALLEKYPKGDMAKQANAQLAKLGDAAHKAPAVVAVLPNPTATPAAVATVAVPKLKTGGEAQEESQQVSQVKVWTYEGYTRVGVYLGGKAKWSVNELRADGDKPPRIYMDVTKAHVGESLKSSAAKLGNDWEVPIGDGLLQRARVNQFAPDTVRVVLDVASMERYEVTQLEDPFRILVDVYGVDSAPITLVRNDDPEALAKRLKDLETASGATPVPVATPLSAEEMQRRIKELEKKNVGYSLTKQLGLKAARIYVDAGHGGHDPGAPGPDGMQEKTITLAIARKVKDKLIDLGYDAVLTRRDDTFLELEERTGIANGGRGDLFVSIHCNSHDPVKTKVFPSGVETYIANLPKDDASARLAAIENANSTETMSGLSAVLETLARNEFTDHSANLAAQVQQSLAKEARKHNPQTKDLGVKTALFYVLLTARMPAILVETAFISNPKDAKRLKDPKYQDKVAESIAQGIEKYLDGNGMKPPAVASDPVKIASEPDGKKKER